MNQEPAVFYYQSFLVSDEFANAVANKSLGLTYSVASSAAQIADWERKMQDQVGLKVSASAVVGILSVSGCVGNGSDDCDGWT